MIYDPIYVFFLCGFFFFLSFWIPPQQRGRQVSMVDRKKLGWIQTGTNKASPKMWRNKRNGGERGGMWRKETNRKWRWRMRTSKKQKNEKDDRENKFYLRYIMFNCWCIKQSLIVQDDLNSFFHVIFHLFENRLCQKRLVEEEEKEKETISNRFYVVFKIFVRKISNGFFILIYFCRILRSLF